MTVKDIPKVELHVHLDGSLDVGLVKELTKYDEQVILDKMVVKNGCNNLTEYLSKFSLPCKLMQSKEVLTRAASHLLNSFYADNVVYVEVRFAPLKHTMMGLSLDEVVQAVLEGFKNSKIKINLILCMMRNDNDVDNLKVIHIAKKYLNKGVCAVDLAGDEISYPTENFEDLFDEAKKLNIPFTIHAGEADGVSSIRNAIKFGSKRIGHGLRCIEDPKLVKEIKDNHIHLEICPISNVQTNVVNSIKNHPVKLLYDYGVSLSINTDNRTVSNTSLNEEYNNLINELGFKISDLVKTNLDALDSSFLSKDEIYLIKLTYFNNM